MKTKLFGVVRCPNCRSFRIRYITTELDSYSKMGCASCRRMFSPFYAWWPDYNVQRHLQTVGILMSNDRKSSNYGDLVEEVP